MKTAIIFFSKTGASAECARELYKAIPESTLVNLAIDTCDIPKFDNIILGGGIRAGMIPAKLKKYVSANELEIQKKNIGIFVCCSDFPHSVDYIEKNFPPVIVKKAVCCAGFGAKMNADEMKGIDRFVAKVAAKRIKKAGGEMPSINYAKIAEFAAKFK